VGCRRAKFFSRPGVRIHWILQIPRACVLLRQTADDLEEQPNAYELGLPPYREGNEDERVALLTARMEAIRVAQQQREQQLDQPKGAKEA